MKNLRLLSLAGLFVICCTENVSSTSQAVQQPNEIVLQTGEFVQQPGEPDQQPNEVVLQTGEPDQQPDALFVQQIINAALAEDITQINQRLEANPDYSIDQQNQEGRTPLHALLYRDNVATDHVVALLKFNPTVTIEDTNRETPLHAAAIRGDQDILQLLVTKILVDRLTRNGPHNPEENTTFEAYSTDLKNRLRIVLEGPISHQQLEDTLGFLRAKAPQNQTRQEFTKLLKAHSYANNFDINFVTEAREREAVRQFDIGLHFTTSILKDIINKNLLHLAVDRENTELVDCICSQIKNPWVLYRLSRAPGTGWTGPIYDRLQENNDNIKIAKKIIHRRLIILLCCIGGSLIATVWLGSISGIGSYLGGLTLEKT